MLIPPPPSAFPCLAVTPISTILGSMTITGGCFCGAVRYAVDAAALTDTAICHCEACRKTTGGTHVTWTTVDRAAFTWTAGDPRALRSSDHGVRFFCSCCGTQLALETSREPETIDIAVTSLDDPGLAPPDRHIWAESMLPWIRPDDGLPAMDRET